jgi:predicted ABC-type ATPase
MELAADRLSPAESDSIYRETIAPFFLNPVSPTTGTPRAVFLAGQPGAGKSDLAAKAMREFRSNGGCVTVNPDDMRVYHPRYLEDAKEDDRSAAAKVHPDMKIWADRLFDDAARERKNIVVDGTLADKEHAEKRISELRSHGYRTEMRAMAVNPRTSWLGVVSRYEKEKGSHTIPRFVPERVHDDDCRKMPETVGALEKQGAFDRAAVYDRKGNALYDSTSSTNRHVSAKEAILAERQREFTPSEKADHRERWEGVESQQENRHAPDHDRKAIAPKVREAKEMVERDPEAKRQYDAWRLPRSNPASQKQRTDLAAREGADIPSVRASFNREGDDAHRFGVAADTNAQSKSTEFSGMDLARPQNDAAAATKSRRFEQPSFARPISREAAALPPRDKRNQGPERSR